MLTLILVESNLNKWKHGLTQEDRTTINRINSKSMYTQNLIDKSILDIIRVYAPQSGHPLGEKTMVIKVLVLAIQKSFVS